jgi:hypothetical protein
MYLTPGKNRKVARPIIPKWHQLRVNISPIIIILTVTWFTHKNGHVDWRTVWTLEYTQAQMGRKSSRRRTLLITVCNSPTDMGHHTIQNICSWNSTKKKRKKNFWTIYSITNWNGSGKVYSKGVLAISKCVLCHFKYLNGLHINLLHIQIYWQCKANHTTDIGENYFILSSAQ